MKILDRHVWKATLYGLLIAWFALVMLDVFFSFIDEVKKTNEHYSTLQALVYMVYTLPSRFYQHFPTSILIGTLLGLGNLAVNSEFTAMRAAGISIRQIVFSVLKLGLVFSLLVFAMGEWLVPAADLQARNFKAHLKNNNVTLVGGNGLWLKEKQSIIHIGSVLPNNRLNTISIYTFNDKLTGLKTLAMISSAQFGSNSWQLNNVQEIRFGETELNKTFHPLLIKKAFINPDILDIGSAKPEQLSINELDTIIKHQKDNKLKTNRYELIYWKRYSVPLSSLVMLILAMPFLFGSNRGGGAGQRVFIGIVVGITFFLTNRAINELSVVYGFSPLLSAFLPSFIFLVGGLFFLSRVR